MATFLDSYIDKMEKAKNSLEDNILSMIVDRESEIRRLIKSRWLLGKRPDGDIIGVYRDYSYQLFKSNKNSLAGGTVDLTLTGDLGDRIKTVLESKGIEVISTDEKFTEISDKYGLDNFNITEEEEKVLLDSIMSELTIKIFNQVWG